MSIRLLSNSRSENVGDSASAELASLVLADGSVDTDAADRVFRRLAVSEEIKRIAAHQFLRISAYAGCNFRCFYCNPRGVFAKRVMSTGEIVDVVKAAREFGITTVHYTGGEPTERSDFVELVKATTLAGMTTIDVTTNGVNLNRPVSVDGIPYDSMAEALHASGLTGVSTSFDTFDPETAREIASPLRAQLTGEDVVAQVTEAIRVCSRLFTQRGKFVVNMVVIRRNLHEIPRLVTFARELGGMFIPRFCELQNKGLAYGTNQAAFDEEYVGRHTITQALEDLGYGQLRRVNRDRLDNQNAHAEYYTFHHLDQVIGIIAPFAHGWPCAKADCTRIRISPTGEVNSCLESPTYRLEGESYEVKKRILQQVIYQKIVRILRRDWPTVHRTDYRRFRFGLDGVGSTPQYEGTPEVHNSVEKLQHE